MSDDDIQKLLDENRLVAVQEVFEAELFAFARAVEKRALIKQKAEWYLMGAEDERRACAQIVDAELDEWESRDICAILRQVASDIRARGG